MAARKQVKEKPVDGGAAGEPANVDATKEAAAEAPVEINVDDFGRLIAGMSRLLVGFGQLKPFSEAGLGLGEWVALNMLAQQEGMSIRLMSRNLGVPTQRVAQIRAALMRAGLVSMGLTEADKAEAEADNAEGGKAGKVMKVTDAGKAKLKAINAELQKALGPMLKPRSMGGALRHIRTLGRGMRTANSDKADKKKARRARQAGAATEAQASQA